MKLTEIPNQRSDFFDVEPEVEGIESTDVTEEAASFSSEDGEEESTEEVAVEEESAALEASDDADEETPVNTQTRQPRSERRIQQLNGQKKEAERKAAETEAKNQELLALIEQMKKANEVQTRLADRQDQFFAAQENQTKSAQRRNLMLQYGLNPEDTRDAIAFEQMEYKAQLESQLQDVQRRLEEQNREVQIEKFNVALNQSLSKRLSSYDVDGDLLDDIRSVAYDIAALHDKTAGEAAEAAVAKFKRTLKNKVTKQTKVPAKVDSASRIVAKTGNRSAPAPTSKVSGKGKTDFLNLLNSGKFFL